MRVKAIVIATLLSALPAMGFAMCDGQKHQTLSCAEEGMVWDDKKQACIKQVNS